MKFIKLDLKHVERLLVLEEKMYWQGQNWRALWKKEARGRFRVFIREYLVHYPESCFGLTDNGEQVIGAMFLLKTLKAEPIPYLHKPFDYFKKDGEVAYVSFFVVEDNKDKETIAQKFYEQAEEVALLKLGCKMIAVVICSSPLEEKVLISNNYRRFNQQFEWEVYPGCKKPCSIYHHELLMKREK